jgi:5-hydroxyisourate hydrolase-like protein (transthyretin family)
MKIKLLLLTCMFTVTALLARAGGETPPNSGEVNKNDLSGGIVDGDNKKPVNSVSITAYTANKKEKTVIADSNGNYSFDDLKPGTYKLVFEKSGYQKVTKDKVVVKSDDGLQLNIEMFKEENFEFVPQLLFDF